MLFSDPLGEGLMAGSPHDTRVGVSLHCCCLQNMIKNTKSMINWRVSQYDVSATVVFQLYYA